MQYNALIVFYLKYEKTARRITFLPKWNQKRRNVCAETMLCLSEKETLFCLAISILLCCN